MDALALLCTLHADGPATWRRLREHDCNSLADLARFETEELAAILGGTPAGARRFLREAQQLSERAGVFWLEREDPAASAADAARLARPAPVAAPAAGARASALPARDQQILERVLNTWREADSRAAPPEAEPRLEPVHLEPEPVLEIHALVPGALDGLDVLRCEQLRAADVLTFEDLVAADLARVAMHSGLGYSRLARWKSLAERSLRAGTAPVAVASLPPAMPSTPSLDHERLSPSEFPASDAARELLQLPLRDLTIPRRAVRWTPVEESAAGPFAQG